MLFKPLAAVGTVNSDTTPAVVISPILLASVSVNHSAAGFMSDGPTVILFGRALGVSMLKVVTKPWGVIRSI